MRQRIKKKPNIYVLAYIYMESKRKKKVMKNLGAGWE